MIRESRLDYKDYLYRDKPSGRILNSARHCNYPA